LLDPPKFTQIGILGLKINHLAAPVFSNALLSAKKCKKSFFFLCKKVSIPKFSRHFGDKKTPKKVSQSFFQKTSDLSRVRFAIHFWGSKLKLVSNSESFISYILITTYTQGVQIWRVFVYVCPYYWVIVNLWAAFLKIKKKYPNLGLLFSKVKSYEIILILKWIWLQELGDFSQTHPVTLATPKRLNTLTLKRRGRMLVHK
jgi:hypothetical protein